jgi:hypothetical protein
MKRVKEDMARGLKADAVLAPIGTVLRLIPFKPNFWHIHIVTTFL